MKVEGRTHKELVAAVRRGIALLESAFPNGRWRQLFKLKEFDFDNPCRCILGTVGQFQRLSNETPWNRGKQALGIVQDMDAAHYGFDWKMEGGNRESEILARLWKAAIKGQPIR